MQRIAGVFNRIGILLDWIVGISSVVVALILIIQAVVSTYLEHKKLHFLHESAVAILFGIIIGLICMPFLQGRNVLVKFYNKLFEKDVFFYILLPIIVFKDGYTLNKNDFFKNFFYIMLYGIFSTLFKFIIISGLTTAMNTNSFITGNIINGNSTDQKLHQYNIIFFAACISSKDSSLAISLLKINKRPKIYSIMLGEQILNDIVVFSIQKTIQTIAADQRDEDFLSDARTYLDFFLTLLEQIIVSLLVGIFFGIFATWLTKICRGLIEQPAISTAFTIYFGYLSFSFCELFEFSGVISVLVCGMILSHYITYNFSKEGATSSRRVTIKALAYACEIFIYIYLGFCATAYSTSSIWSYSMILTEFFLIIPFARLISMIFTHVLAIIFRCKTKKTWRINRYEFFIIFLSGVIRGPVAFALVQNQSLGGKTSFSSYIIDSTTISIIIMGTVFIGGSLYYIMEWAFEAIVKDPKLNQEYTNYMKESDLTDKHHKSMKKSLLLHTTIEEPELDLKSYKKFRSKTQKKFSDMDENYLKPFLIYNYKERKENITTAKKENKKIAKEEELIKEEDKDIFFEDFIRIRKALGLPNLTDSKKSKVSNKKRVTFQKTDQKDGTELAHSKIIHDSFIEGGKYVTDAELESNETHSINE